MRRILVAAAVLAAAVASAALAVSLPAYGRTLVTWTAPHGRPAGVVLVIHGGAWRASGPRTVALMDARARTFAGWGWAAAVVDYRAFRLARRRRAGLRHGAHALSDAPDLCLR